MSTFCPLVLVIFYGLLGWPSHPPSYFIRLADSTHWMAGNHFTQNINRVITKDPSTPTFNYSLPTHLPRSPRHMFYSDSNTLAYTLVPMDECLEERNGRYLCLSSMDIQQRECDNSWLLGGGNAAPYCCGREKNKSETSRGICTANWYWKCKPIDCPWQALEHSSQPGSMRKRSIRRKWN